MVERQTFEDDRITHVKGGVQGLVGIPSRLELPCLRPQKITLPDEGRIFQPTAPKYDGRDQRRPTE